MDGTGWREPRGICSRAVWFGRGIETMNSSGAPRQSGGSSVSTSDQLAFRCGELAAMDPGEFFFGLLENGDVRIGVLPESKEVLVGFLCLHIVAEQDVRSGDAEMRERVDDVKRKNSLTIDDFLKFTRSSSSRLRLEVSQTANINAPQHRATHLCVFEWPECFECLRRIVPSQFNCGPDCLTPNHWDATYRRIGGV